MTDYAALWYELLRTALYAPFAARFASSLHPDKRIVTSYTALDNMTVYTAQKIYHTEN